MNKTLYLVVAMTLAAGVTDSLVDQSDSSTCFQASSMPALGFLYPLGMELNVNAAGRVGIGTANPTERLTVVGAVHSTAGGFEFPDQTVSSTATPVGSMGPDGDPGPQGVPGPEGDPGVTSLNGQGGAATSVTIIGTGNASVSTPGNTITVNIAAPACTYENRTYAQGARCYLNPFDCTNGQDQGNFLTCQSDGSWQVGFQFCTSSYPTNNICGQ